MCFLCCSLVTHVGLHINPERKGRAERQRGREAAAGVVLHSQPCCYARSNISPICSEKSGRRAEDLLHQINTDNVNLTSFCACVRMWVRMQTSLGRLKQDSTKMSADREE